MIQSLLSFIFGVLLAVFLALLAAPAVSRRAVQLTRKRLEASLPMTLNEIQADKDKARAEFAMATRRLEIELRAARERTANQEVELGRLREAAKTLEERLEAQAAAIMEHERTITGLRGEIAAGQEEKERLTQKLEEAEKGLAEAASRHADLDRLYQEASFSASTRQIDLVARESEIEKLSGNLSALRARRQEDERRRRDAVGEASVARETLANEQRRVADLEKRVAAGLAAIADHEDRLARRERELVRLREGQGSGPAEAAVGDLQEPSPAGLADEERERLRARLDTLTRENRRIKKALAGRGDPGPETADAGKLELRSKLAELAAEVVHLTARLEGPDSPISHILAAGQDAGANAPHDPVSLADRVRALQEDKGPG